MSTQALATVLSILISYTALAEAPGKAPKVPASTSLLQDEVWGQPLRYIDFILLRAVEELQPSVDGLAKSKRMFRPLSFPMANHARVHGLVDATSGRAVLGAQFTVQKTLIPVREACDAFFLLAEGFFGARLPVEQRTNVLSYRTPPSAKRIPRVEQLAASQRLVEQLDFRVQIYEEETHRVHTCLKPAASGEVTVSVK